MSIDISEAPQHAIRIEFADDGNGIAPELLNKIFDPFFTTARSRGNTGLGLHIAFNLVNNVLQGKLEAASRLGHGTRFIITMPARAAPAERERLSA